MKIYLARHGESLPHGHDDERLLSKKGREEIQQLADFIAPSSFKISRLFHSIKQRTHETAKILAPAFSFHGIPEIREGLDPLHRVLPIAYEIHQLTSDALFVGHMPFMSHLVGELVANSEDKDMVMFKTGSLLCLEKIENQWLIRWMLNPELLQFL
jgi:phosphohistidine phosphatase